MKWIEDLKEKFNSDDEIKNLQENNFFGNIQINFFNGKVVDLNIYKTKKPIKK